MNKINQSVGKGGANQRADVLVVQRLLNLSLQYLIPLMRLKEDGDCGPVTVGMITEFQRRVLKLKRPDGRVDPGKGTFKKLLECAQEQKNAAIPPDGGYSRLLLAVQVFYSKSAPKARGDADVSTSRRLTEADYQRAAALTGVELAAVKAVASVESTGGGFLSGGKPKILFEGHWFSRLTKGAFDAKHPTISYKKWTKSHYKGGSAEYSRYDAAYALDSEAAMKSTSWGKFQIMGFNHSKAGYSTVADFVKAMHVSEGKHLEAFVKFLKATGLDEPLKIKDWAGFAKGYNGPAYAQNKYDLRLQQAYEAYSSKSVAGKK